MLETIVTICRTIGSYILEIVGEVSVEVEAAGVVPTLAALTGPFLGYLQSIS
jgi:hypothetical protein